MLILFIYIFCITAVAGTKFTYIINITKSKFLLFLKLITANNINLILIFN
jgi:hypothetical protein